MLLLLLLQVFASCLWLGHSEVVADFQSCPQFFFQATPPSKALLPNSAAYICQRFNNQHYYATLYNRDMRIPVYSAYLYDPQNTTKPGNVWMIEPQLLGTNYPNAMEKEKKFMHESNVTLQQIMVTQAVSGDYKNLKDFDHGHMSPSYHRPTFNSKKSTFTLTNVVPQYKELNDGKWSYYEMQIMINKTKGCNTTYVVVGAVPGNNFIGGDRVNIPSHIWSSACCEMDNNQMNAWGVIAENDKNEIELLSLGDLENRLNKLYNKPDVSLFHSDCPRQ
ncbi:ENDD1 protein, partial [Pedionomus torquatus]|nr:ENDD1 protein [Pedionomus torquatus]